MRFRIRSLGCMAFIDPEEFCVRKSSLNVSTLMVVCSSILDPELIIAIDDFELRISEVVTPRQFHFDSYDLTHVIL